MEPRSLKDSLRHLFTRVLFAGEPATDQSIRGLSLVVVLLLPAAILYPTLGFHLLEPDEGRYAQIPKEMLLNNSWVVPTLQGEPYLDKPPLLYWLVALSYQAFGVTPIAARLVPAVCVHLTILAIYLIGRRSIGERAAFWASLLVSVAPGFVSVARLLLLDGLLTLCVTLSVLCGFEAVRTGRFRPPWWLAAALASGLGFLTKGPISEVLLFVPLWAYAFLSTSSARVRWYWYAVFIAIVVAVNVPWYVAMYREQPQFLGYFFWQHNVMRFLQPFDHLQPIWFYAPILLAGLLPGTVLLAACLWRLARGEPATDVARSKSHPATLVASSENAMDQESAPLSHAGGFWLLAGAWCVLFFSCSGSKLPTYILPAYPFLCLAIGEFVARSRWERAPATRGMVAAAAVLVFVAHHFAVPWYARERSPFGRPELVARYVEDPEMAVICFPRHCDSVAFYTDRADLRNVRTKDVNQMFVDCHHRERTVILFTHRESFESFKRTMPPSLAIVESQTLRRGYGNALLDRLFGSTPWGLCDVAVVTPLYQVPPAE